MTNNHIRDEKFTEAARRLLDPEGVRSIYGGAATLVQLYIPPRSGQIEADGEVLDAALKIVKKVLGRRNGNNVQICTGIGGAGVQIPSGAYDKLSEELNKKLNVRTILGIR